MLVAAPRTSAACLPCSRALGLSCPVCGRPAEIVARQGFDQPLCTESLVSWPDSALFDRIYYPLSCSSVLQMSEPAEVEVPEDEKKLDRESAAAEKSLDKLTDKVLALPPPQHGTPRLVV